MGAIRFLLVFVLVTVMATVAVITAAFIFWSYLPVQPGTATALATLFLVAPGVGIAMGLVVAIRVARRPVGDDDVRRVGYRGWVRWLSIAFAAVVGWLFGYGVCLVAIDLSYPHRLIDPGSAPDWLSAMPNVAGLTVAVVIAIGAYARGSGEPRLGS